MATFVKNQLKDDKTSWTAVVRMVGSPQVKKTFRTKKDAAAWARMTEDQIGRQGAGMEDVEATKHTLEELIDRFLADDRFSMDRSSQQRLRWWKSRIGHLRLVQVKPSTIIRQREALARGAGTSGNPASAATCNRYLAALSKVCKVAITHYGWLSINPCREIEQVTEDNRRERILDDGERVRLLEACRNSDEPRLYPLVVTALYSGGRKSELLGLKWSDLEAGENYFTAELRVTKNKQRRILVIPGPAFTAMVEWREDNEAKRLSGMDHIFSNGDESMIPVNWFPRAAWLEALEEAEIEGFVFHSLRHCCGTMMAESGASLIEIANHLGHRSLQMVRRYSHITQRHQVTAANRMAEMFRD